MLGKQLCEFSFCCYIFKILFHSVLVSGWISEITDIISEMIYPRTLIRSHHSGWVGLLHLFLFFLHIFLGKVSVFVKNIKNSPLFNSTALQNRLSYWIFPTFITEIFPKASHWNFSKSGTENYFKTNYNYLLQITLFKKYVTYSLQSKINSYVSSLRILCLNKLEELYCIIVLSN